MSQWPLPPGEPAIYPSTPGGVTAPTLSNWQLYYNGVTFGAGTNVGTSKIEGLGGLPTVNSQDQPFPRDSGEYVGVDAMGGRDPVIDLVVTQNIFVQMSNLAQAFAAGGNLTQPLWFQLPGLPTLCSMVRPRSRPTTWDTNVSAAGMWTPTITFHANDPRLYTQAQTWSNSTSGGAITQTIDNSGNCEVRPVLILTGPLVSPSITNTTVSVSNPPAIAFSFGASIAFGDQVVIDTSTPHTVIYYTGGLGSGGSSFNVYNDINQATTSWWNLLPGNNSLVFGDSSGGGYAAGQFQVWWPNGYLL